MAKLVAVVLLTAVSAKMIAGRNFIVVITITLMWLLLLLLLCFFMRLMRWAAGAGGCTVPRMMI